jgi:exosortase
MSTASLSPPTPWKRWIPTPPVMGAWGVLLLAFIWNYWPAMLKVVRTWATTPDMGHGFVVPLFAAYLLWRRQDMVDPWPNRGTLWCIPFFIIFAIIRWLNLYLNYERDIDSIFPFLLGMTLALGGWKALRWAWPSILFLIFMVPLPGFVAEAMARNLQRIATIMSVYSLQTMGIPAIVSGDGSNVIQLSDPANKLNVAEACSGLRMMTVFYAMCIGACFVIREPWWKKVVLVVSAAPIAIISNVSRITLDGMLTEWISPRAGSFVHEWGVLMVIPAILLVWGELALLSALLIEPVSEGPLVFTTGEGVLRRRSSPAGTEGKAESGRVGPMPGLPRRPRQM